MIEKGSNTDRNERQLKKGVLEILVLKLLSEKDEYGYQLLTELKEMSNGMFSMKEGTLYPILYRLQDDGLIVSKWNEPEERQAPRKYYAITDEGRKYLVNLVRLWRSFSTEVNNILGV